MVDMLQGDKSRPQIPTSAVKDSLAEAPIHELWESVFRNRWSERIYDAAFGWIAKTAGIPHGSDWLDIGCGIGQHSLRLAKHGYRVTAADFSPNRVEAATSHIRATAMDAAISVQREDLVSGLSFASQSFDAILCWGVLMHVPEVEEAMRELVRVTRVGGKIFIAESNLHGVDPIVTRYTSFAKNLIGSPYYLRVSMTAFGREYWVQTSGGLLFVRHARISSLVSFFRAHGCELRHRIGVEFTERYGMGGFVGRLCHAWNWLWFRMGHLPYLATGNLLVFERLR